jgi:hypothetical protein
MGHLIGGDIRFERNRSGGPGLSRRRWLQGTLLGLTGAWKFASAQTSSSKSDIPTTANEADTIARVNERAKRLGLSPFTETGTEHFLGLGNAPHAFQKAALGICEEFAARFLAYFRQHRFTLSLPQQRLTAVILKDDRTYGTYDGQEPGEDEGGHYDLDTNQLVMFDFRPKKADLNEADKERANTFSLVHETAHLLSFNTGLLSREADVPVCISEGLATHVELWQRSRRSPLGAINEPRLQVLKDAGRGLAKWIPVDQLLADDKPFVQPERVQWAYAECWLLVHYLIKTPAKLPRFRDYLSAIPKARPANERAKYAESRLGPLKTLDQDVRIHARRLLRR